MHLCCRYCYLRCNWCYVLFLEKKNAGVGEGLRDASLHSGSDPKEVVCELVMADEVEVASAPIVHDANSATTGEQNALPEAQIELPIIDVAGGALAQPNDMVAVAAVAASYLDDQDDLQQIIDEMPWPYIRRAQPYWRYYSR